MSTPSDSSIKGKFNEVIGEAKQSLGEAVGNQKLANDGAADQLKGQAQQAWGSVKEGAEDWKQQHDTKAAQEGHQTRDKVVDAAESVKEHIQAGVDHLTGKR